MSKSGRASPGGATTRFDFADAAFGIRVGALLFAPDGRGQHKVRKVAGRRGMKAILHNQKVDVAKRLLEQPIVGERDRGIGGDEPQRLDLVGDSRLDDVGIRKPTRLRNSARRRYSTSRRVPAGAQRFRICDSQAGWK